jgi:hypothetical protein
MSPMAKYRNRVDELTGNVGYDNVTLRVTYNPIHMEVPHDSIIRHTHPA